MDTRQQLLESLRMHQYETPLNSTNKEQLKYMLQLIQACEGKGAFDATNSETSSIVAAEEIRLIKRSIINKLETPR
jgi:hypothetical protein